MQKVLKYWFCVFFLYPGKLVFAQEETAFTIFSTGNVYGEKPNDALLNQWQKRIGMQKNFAVLLAGNAVDAQTGKFANELLLNEKHPMLVAPGKTEWAGGSRNGKDFIKQLTDDLPEKYDNPFFSPMRLVPGQPR